MHTFVAALPSNELLVSDSRKDEDFSRACVARLRLNHIRTEAERIETWSSSTRISSDGAKLLSQPSGLAVAVGSLSDGEQQRPIAFVADAFAGGIVQVSVQLGSLDDIGRQSLRRLDVFRLRNGENRLSFPMGCAFSVASGRLFVVDGDHHRVVAMDPQAAARSTREAHECCPSPYEGTPTSWLFAIGSGQGSGAGQLQDPFGVAVHEGKVYVTDAGNGRVSVFDEHDGHHVGVVLGTGKLEDPSGIAFTSRGSLVVADTTGKIRFFDLEPSGLTVTREAHCFDLEGDLAGVVCVPPELAEAGEQEAEVERVFVVNSTKKVIHVLEPATLAHVRVMFDRMSDCSRLRGLRRTADEERQFIEAMQSIALM